MPKILREPIKSLDDAPDFITIGELAFIFRCSHSKIIRLMNAGKLRSVKLVGARVIETASARQLVSPALETA